ncbi:unnamed protein product [Trichobilharzia szidati]|nr:unnamed protein product [Trichobilharzia szidati]
MYTAQIVLEKKKQKGQQNLSHEKNLNNYALPTDDYYLPFILFYNPLTLHSAHLRDFVRLSCFNSSESEVSTTNRGKILFYYIGGVGVTETHRPS